MLSTCDIMARLQALILGSLLYHEVCMTTPPKPITSPASLGDHEQRQSARHEDFRGASIRSLEPQRPSVSEFWLTSCQDTPSTGTICTTNSLGHDSGCFLGASLCLPFAMPRRGMACWGRRCFVMEEIGKNAGTDDHLVAPDRRGSLRYSFSQEDAVADTAVVLDELHELGVPARP